ncbi:hypothetical protein NXF25_020187 [Crotalus adamanteus]|uniref:LRRC37A/B like protein 1 C-terminal domain-containing protein n=1 Tax=Crotalus adamanteus TaxID=8729 RepID=A0AAW1B3Y5_CROAD
MCSMGCVATSATQLFFVGILLVCFIKRLDGFILLCPASNINCRRNTKSPTYDNLHIQEKLGNSIEIDSPSILKSVSRLNNPNSHKYLDEKGSHENLLKRLYKSHNDLQVAPKAKITENAEESQELDIQKALCTITKTSGEIRLGTKSPLEGLKSYENMIQRDHRLEKYPRKKDLAVRFLTNRRRLSETIGKLAGEQVKPTSDTMERLRIQQEIKQEGHDLGKNPREEDLFLKFITKRRKFAGNVGKLAGEQVKPIPYAMVEQLWKPVGQQGPMKDNRQPKMSPKAKIIANVEKKYDNQKRVVTEILEVYGDISMRTKSLLEKLRLNQETRNDDFDVVRNPKEEDLFLKSLTKKRQFAENFGIPAGEQVKPVPYAIVEQLWKPVGQQGPMKENWQPQVSPKTKITNNVEKKYNIQKKVSTEFLETSSGISLWNESPLESLSSCQEKRQEDHELEKNPTKEYLFLRFLIKRQQFAENLKLAGDHVKPDPYTMVEQWWKSVEPKGPLKINGQLQLSLKAKLIDNVEKKYDIQKKMARHFFETSSGITQRNESPLEILRSHQEIKQEGHGLGKNPREEDLFLSFLTKKQQFSGNTGKPTGEQVKPVPYRMVEKWWKPIGQQGPMKDNRQSQVSLKAKITDNVEKKDDIQKNVATEILEVSGEINPRTKNPLEILRKNRETIKDGFEFLRNPKEQDLFLRFLTKRRQFAENVGKFAEEQVKLVPYRMAEQWWKPVGPKGPIKVNGQPQVSPKAKTTDNVEKKYDMEKKVATEFLEASGAISLWNESPLERLRSHQEITQDDQEIERNPREEDLFVKFLIKRQEFAANFGKRTGEKIKSVPYPIVQQWWKPVGQQGPMKDNEQSQVPPKAKITYNYNPLERLRNHQKTRQEDHELGKNAREEELFSRFLRKRRGFAKSTLRLATEQGKLTSHFMVEKTGNSEVQEEPQQLSSLNRLPQASVHSLRKRSILHLPTELPPLTYSTVVDGGGEEEASKVIFILKSGNTSARPSHGNHSVISEQIKEQNIQSEQIIDNILAKGFESQDSRRENLLKHLIIGGSNARRPTDEAKTLNERLPQKTLSNEVYWEYQEETTSAPLLSDFFSTTDNSLLQGDVFETEVQILLAHLILNERIRNLISHLIRLIKVDCRELTIQNSCGFLISKIGLVMKLYSKRKNIQEASALLKSSLFLEENVKNMTTASSRKMEKPSDEVKAT